MTYFKKLLSLTLFLMVVSCSTETKSYTSSSSHSSVSSQQVEILGDTPNRPYKVLGEITEKGILYSSDQGMRESVQNEAAKLGADAVIITSHTKSGYDFLVGQKKQINALAIKWTGPAGATSKPQPSPASSSNSSGELPLPQPQ